LVLLCLVFVEVYGGPFIYSTYSGIGLTRPTGYHGTYGIQIIITRHHCPVLTMAGQISSRPKRTTRELGEARHRVRLTAHASSDRARNGPGDPVARPVCVVHA
jgi:hypothetical protein